MKQDPVQSFRRKSGTGLMLLCAGMVAVMLAESGAFLLIGLVMELAGLAMFIGGMWQQKKIRDAQQAALAKEALAQADTGTAEQPGADAAPQAEGTETDDTAQPNTNAAPSAEGTETDDTAQPNTDAAPQADGAETAQPAKAGEKAANAAAEE